VLLNTPGSDGTVASAYFGEKPESDDPDDFGYKLQIFTNHTDEESVTNAPNKFPNNQKRNYFFTNGKLVLNPAWDWEAYPITFNVILEFQAGNAGFEPVYDEADVDTFISPLENTDGYVSFGYEAWDTEWDEEGGYEIVEKNGSVQLNATQIYKQFGTGKGTLKIGELYIDNDDTEYEFSMSTDLAKDTLPHLWKTKLKTESSSGYTKWWTKIYRVTGTSPIDFEELEGETPAGYTDTNSYCLGRWGSINVWLKVLPDFHVEDAPGVKAHKVPNLIGMTTEEDDDDIVPFVDDFITAWNADADNPYIEKGETNLQAHWDAPINRIISQSPRPDTILPYGVHDSGNPLPISYVASAGAPTKDIDKVEGYAIPKVTGMTLADAVAFIAANYPTWSIDDENVTYHYSYNFPIDTITSQTPDWTIRTTPLGSLLLSVSISLGLPDGKVIPNLRGETLTNALTALDAINCDCPESHRIAQYHATIPAGSVIAQIPSSLPYRLVPEIETKVGLAVSLGASPDGLYNTPVPLVIGRNIDDTYIDDLESAGWDIVQIPVYCEGEPGLIVDQIPRYCQNMGELDTNRLIVAVASDQKSLVTEGSESGDKR